MEAEMNRKAKMSRTISKCFSVSTILLTVALVFASCNRNAIYSHYESIAVDGWGWEHGDTMGFSVPPVSEGGLYSEEIGVRTSGTFPFRDLVLLVHHTVMPEGRRWTDTVDVAIVGEDGAPQGDGISLVHHSTRLPNLMLNEGDSLHVSISHFMRLENLPGISDVGVTLRQIKE